MQAIEAEFALQNTKNWLYLNFGYYGDITKQKRGEVPEFGLFAEFTWGEDDNEQCTENKICKRFPSQEEAEEGIAACLKAAQLKALKQSPKSVRGVLNNFKIPGG